jgi:cobalt-zinc-cadmium efflux system membrane fusion protein
MTNNSHWGMKSVNDQASRALRVLLLATALAAPLAGCGKKSDGEQAAPKPANVTLTAEQRQRIGFYTVTPDRFRSSVNATGVVDFDNDQATSVLAPISGPVARLLVQPGDKVRKGQALATVASPDYASAISTYAKALVTAQNTRRLADADKDLAQHQGVSQREAEQAQTDAASAEADRDAALTALKSLDVDPQTIRDIEAGKPARGEGVIRAPLSGTVVEKLITPGQFRRRHHRGQGGRPCHHFHRHLRRPAWPGRQYRRAGQSRYPRRAGPGGGGQSRRPAEEADVRAGQP